MTGEESFNEVFMDGVIIDDSMRLGPRDEGWAVALAILQTERGELGQRRVGGIDVHRLIERHRGTTDPTIRQRLTQHYSRDRVLSWMAWRGYGEGLEAQVIKLMRAEANMELQEMALNHEGPAAVAYDGSDPGVAEITYGFLRSRANSIAGGTSEIMRNVIGERLLGLPRDPRARSRK
jgi:alkylation response protein AidB-like acyl-CoA dehydrogenase